MKRFTGLIIIALCFLVSLSAFICGIYVHNVASIAANLLAMPYIAYNFYSVYKLKVN